MTTRSTVPAAALLAAFVSCLSADAARAATFDCVMDPAQKVKVGSSVTGVLDKVYVKRGDTVKAGDKIAELNFAVEAANVSLARLQADSDQSVQAQRSRLALAQQKLERAEPLAAKGITTQEKLEEAKSQAEIAERDLGTELVKQKLAKIELERAQAMLDLRTIRSPINGLVMDKNMSAGEFVNQEAFILTLVQMDPLYVEAYVPVSYWGKIHKGLLGTVHPAEPVGGAYKAPVTVVDRVFDAASGTFGVRLELDNPGNALPAGERCKIDFDLEDVPVATALPKHD